MYDVFNKRVYYYYYSYPDFILACHQRALEAEGPKYLLHPSDVSSGF